MLVIRWVPFGVDRKEWTHWARRSTGCHERTSDFSKSSNGLQSSLVARTENGFTVWCWSLIAFKCIPFMFGLKQPLSFGWTVEKGMTLRNNAQFAVVFARDVLTDHSISM